MDLKREHELGQTAEARKRTDRDLRCIGWGLVLLGVLMPALVTVENTGIYRTLMNGIYQGQEIYHGFQGTNGKQCLYIYENHRPQYCGRKTVCSLYHRRRKCP